MDTFAYHDGQLHCEATPLEAIADAVGTPTYVYSGGALLHAFEAYERALAALPHLSCYAVKANMNLAVLALLARAGAGADVLFFNVESAAELAAMDEVARAEGTRARIGLRVNPDIDPQTHPYIATGLK